MKRRSSCICPMLPPSGDTRGQKPEGTIIPFSYLVAKHTRTCHSFKMCTLISQLKLWSHHRNSIMFPERAPLNTTHSPPSSQAQLILTINIWKCFWIPIYGQQNALKSVVLISKHLTLEWWLLAGEYAACQGCIWRKWLSSYPTRTVWPVFHGQDHITQDYFGASAIFLNYAGLCFLVSLIDLNGFHYESFVVDAHTQKPKGTRGCTRTQSSTVDMQIFSNPFTRVRICDTHHQSCFPHSDSQLLHLK